jgi:adenosylmethionine-8-amino-7-oxononanoate aminotransferase
MDEITTQSNLLRVFPNDEIPPFIEKTDGMYLYKKNGEKILDTTAGGTSYNIVGWNNKKVNNAINNQLKKFFLILIIKYGQMKTVKS